MRYFISSILTFRAAPRENVGVHLERFRKVEIESKWF